MREEKKRDIAFDDLTDQQINDIKDDFERKIYLRFAMCGNDNVAFFEHWEVKEVFAVNGVKFNAIIFQKILYRFLIFWHDNYIMIRERISIEDLIRNKRI